MNDTGNEDGEEVEKALVDALPHIPRRQHERVGVIHLDK